MVFFFLVYGSISRVGFQGKGFVLLQVGISESKGESKERERERGLDRTYSYKDDVTFALPGYFCA